MDGRLFPDADVPAADARGKAALSVLIVDDHAALRSGLARMLRSHAALPLLAVLEAASSTEALQVLRERRPDLVLLDVDLAGEDGLALLPLPGAVVVVLTSHAQDPDVRVRAQAGGAAAVLSKALPGAVLNSTIVSLMALADRS